MTKLSWLFLGLAVIAAASDWVGVGERWKSVEYLTKPLAMVALIGVALALHAEVPGRRPWIVAALLLSLLGDVFLMVPRDLFVAGLGSFLLAHLAYIVAFRIDGGSAGALAVSAVVVAVAVGVVGRKVIAGARTSEPAVTVPVVIYIAVIAAMVACALATGNVLFGVGAVLFMTSDSLIAWNRFRAPKADARPPSVGPTLRPSSEGLRGELQPLSWVPLAIIVTYHVAQALLVTGMST
jgi:uncharacterized membrane protein YhhN